MPPLAQLDVLAVDCQATAAAPGGHLLELGWGRARPGGVEARSRLIRLPGGLHIPPSVTRITGIRDSMVRSGVDGSMAWRELADDALKAPPAPARTVIHFARFERPFLRTLADGVPPLDIVCTHEIARRLLPGLPRRSLRALTGYFGRSVGTLRRSAEHVEATAFIWFELLRLLDAQDVTTWESLQRWLAAPATLPARRARVWPMPRDLRLSLPDAPGIYRFQRANGDILYVGKGASLHHRVNSYFRKQHGVPERALEMLSQARAVSVDITATVLEAALLEPDEIKRHQPPYNIALTESRDLWFATRDLGERRASPSPHCVMGPFPSAQVLDQFAAFARRSRAALGDGRRAPDAATFAAGCARLCAQHGDLAADARRARSQLLRLGMRLWREGRRDAEVVSDEWTLQPDVPAWTPEQVQEALERLALRAALARRRAAWLSKLVEAAIVWREPGGDCTRLILIERGEIVGRESVAADTTPPVPRVHARTLRARHEAITIATFDRLRVLTTEVKRLVAASAPVAIRFGPAPPISGQHLAAVLAWL